MRDATVTYLEDFGMLFQVQHGFIGSVMYDTDG